MKTLTVDAQVWWIALVDEIRPSDGLDLAAVWTALKQKYGFLGGPIKESEGSAFTEGALRREGYPPIIISKLVIFNDGINVQVQGDTIDADIVFDDVLKTFYSFGVRRPITSPLKYYVSTMVADFNTSLDQLFPVTLLNKISETFQIDAKSQFLSLGFSADKSTLRGRIAMVNPTVFNIARRVDLPFEMNRYFSQANLTSNDHANLLEELELLAQKSK
jgi:hypothetical protein